MTPCIYLHTRGGDPKIPGIVKKIDLKYFYKFETLVPFEVLPLRLDAAFPLKVLDNVSSIGSGVGIAASSRRGSFELVK